MMRSILKTRVMRSNLIHRSAVLILIILSVLGASLIFIPIHHQSITQVNLYKSMGSFLSEYYSHKSWQRSSTRLISKQLIPKVFHQHWVDYNIPQGIKQEWLQSWLQKNPDWEYWFWSEEDVRCFLSREYPWFLKYYNSYSFGMNNGGIFRGDAMRYFILYHFGGAYADLDAECFRSLEDFVNHDCVIPEENPVHALVANLKNENNLINFFMMCSPGHPYMKAITHELPKRVNLTGVLYSTGPFMMTDVWKKYINQTSYVNTGKQPNVTIGSYKLFNPSYDRTTESIVKLVCIRVNQIPSNFITPEFKVVCEELVKRNFTYDPYAETYVDHNWVHMSLNNKWNSMEKKDIRQIVNSTKTYQRDIAGYC